MVDAVGIISPRVPFLDARTGDISREWYRFLVGVAAQSRASDNTAQSFDELLISPLPIDQYASEHDVKILDTPAALVELEKQFQSIMLCPIQPFPVRPPHLVIQVSADTVLPVNGGTAWAISTGWTVTLPPAASTPVGTDWMAILGVVGTMVIGPDGSDVIILSAGTTVTLATKGESATFRCLDASTWGVV